MAAIPKKPVTNAPAPKIPPKQTEITPVTNDVPAHLQKYLEQDAGSGFEHLRQQDIIYPRLRILQPSSEEAVKYGLPVGGMVDSVTKELLADRDSMLEFLIVSYFVSWVEWGDRDAGEGLLESSIDPGSSLAVRSMRREKKQISKGEVLAVTEYYNFMVILRGKPDTVYQMPCYRTSHKHGKMLLNLARSRKINGVVAPIYTGVYSVSTEYKEEDKRQWFEFHFDNAGFGTEEEIAVTSVLHKELKKQIEENRIAYAVEDEAPTPSENAQY